jgi:hypothetical protein
MPTGSTRSFIGSKPIFIAKKLKYLKKSKNERLPRSERVKNSFASRLFVSRYFAIKKPKIYAIRIETIIRYMYFGSPHA